MNKLSESLIDDVISRSRNNKEREEDFHIPDQDPVHWWRGIELENPKKYTKDEVKSLEISYGIIRKVEKLMNVDTPEMIWVFFKGEAWQLTIEHITSYGNSTYAMNVHGDYSPWFDKYSSLSVGQKRSIKQRLDFKTFYVYTISKNKEYCLREEPEYKGQKGVLLK